MRIRQVLSTWAFLLVMHSAGAEAQETQAVAAPAAAAREAREGLGEEEVRAGVAAYEEADFEGALQAFDRAAAQGLDRALLVRVLAHRVLIAQASGDAASLEVQALRLVTLDPEALRDEASPELTRALERARSRADGVVRLRIEHEVSAGGVTLRARVEGDVAGLVREVHLRAGRAPNALVAGENGVVQLEGASLEGIVLVAECVGPGNAILAQEGTAGAPASLATTTARNVLQAPVVQAGDDTGLHVGLVLGGAAIVIVAVVVGVLVTDANAPRSQLSGPVVEW